MSIQSVWLCLSLGVSRSIASVPLRVRRASLPFCCSPRRRCRAHHRILGRLCSPRRGYTLRHPSIMRPRSFACSLLPIASPSLSLYFASFRHSPCSSCRLARRCRAAGVCCLLFLSARCDIRSAVRSVTCLLRGSRRCGVRLRGVFSFPLASSASIHVVCRSPVCLLWFGLFSRRFASRFIFVPLSRPASSCR